MLAWVFANLLDFFTRKIVGLALIIGIIITGYISFDVSWVYFNNAQKDRKFQLMRQTQAYPGELDEDCIGWLELYGTSINYPLMQGEDNSEFLNKDPFGKYSLSGSIFLDCDCSPDLSDEYSIVYGHHMENGQMFGALDEYSDSVYLSQHSEGEIEAGETIHSLKVFAYYETTTIDRIVFASAGPALKPDHREKLMADAREHGAVFDDPGSGKIVALTTCMDAVSSKREVLLCLILD